MCWGTARSGSHPAIPPNPKMELHMVSAADRVTDERVTCLRIFADAAGETHMEDVDIAFQPRKLFKDNPPLRLSDNSFPSSAGGPTGGARGFRIVLKTKRPRAKCCRFYKPRPEPGLATATAERVVAGSRKIEVARVGITDAGRRAAHIMRRRRN